ncbi:right-handed parallel beta-helix repeat-containing protein [Candidatus Pacearchaeota archaeon]|nr:right-handed parallel beta-helix repeat-containing protein [Candidatus Pacearchaeota archaeon]
MTDSTPIVSIVDVAGAGDFSSMATWESTQQRNLVTADEQEICMISSSGAVGSVHINGWTTDHHHRITVMPYGADAYHDGIATGETAACLATSSWGLRVDGVPNITFRGIHVASGSTYGIILHASGCLVDNCIIDGNAGATNYGIYAFGNTTWGNRHSIVQNTVIHGAVTGVYVNNTNTTNRIRLTVINCTIDSRSAQAFRANGGGARIWSENNILEGTTIYSNNGGIIVRGQKDITSDISAVNVALRNIPMSGIVVNDDDAINSAPFDYHLDTTPGPTLASGVAASGIFLPGSGIGFDFVRNVRPPLANQISIGVHQWSRGIDFNSNIFFGA